MKINLDELKRAINRIESDKGSTIINIEIPLDRNLEIRYTTTEQDVKIILYPEEVQKFPEILKKERL